MPKILIICDVYPPSFAPRMGYLVKYIKEWNWTADIVTRSHDGDLSFQSLLGSEKILRVQGVKIPMKTTKNKVSRLMNQKSHRTQNGKLIAKQVLNTLNSNDYKLILCSTSHRTFILDAAYQVARTWNKPWVADLRDIFEQLPKVRLHKSSWFGYMIDQLNKDYRRFDLKKRNISIRHADTVVTITPWHVKKISKYNSNTHLIYNGYSPDIFFPKPKIPQKIFKITYTGVIFSIYYQDPTFLFLAVKKLVESGFIDKVHFRIQFYTPKNWRKYIIENQAYQEVKEFVDFFDYVDTAVVPDILSESSILLLLANLFKEDGPKSIMPTKYFEYLAVEKPILCVRSDEDLLEVSIKKANVGIAARTVDETYDFLFEKWKEWKEIGYTTVEANREYTQQFSRKLQAKQFVDLFENIIAE